MPLKPLPIAFLAACLCLPAAAATPPLPTIAATSARGANATTGPSSKPAMDEQAFAKTIADGAALLQQEKWQQAAETFTQARQLAPDDPRPMRGLAEAESHMPGRESRAILWHCASLAANPDASDRQEVYAAVQRLQTRHDADVMRLLEQMQTMLRQLPSTAGTEHDLSIVENFWQVGKYVGVDRIPAYLQGDTSYNAGLLLDAALGQAAEGEVDLANQTLAKVGSGNLTLQEPSNAVAVAAKQARAGKIQMALDTFSKIPPHRTKDEALAYLAVAQAAAGDMPGAQKFLDLLTDGPAKKSFPARIAQLQVYRGDLPGALETLATIPAGPSQDKRDYGMTGPRGGRPAGQRTIDYHSDALGNIILALVESKELANAVSLVDAIEDPCVRAAACGKIAQAQIQSGDLPAARKMLAAQFKCVPNIAEDYLRRGCYRSLMDLQKQAHDGPGLLRTMPAFRGGMDEVLITTTYLGGDFFRNLLRDLVIEPTDIDEVRALLDKSPTPDIQDMMRARLAVAQAQSGKIKEALQTLETVSNAGFVVSACETIAALQAQAGDFAGALATAQKLGVNGGSPGIGLILSFVPMQARAGDRAGALQTAQALSWPRLVASATADVGVIQAQSGDVAGALVTAQSLADSARKAEVLAAVAKAQLQAGAPDAARRTLGLAIDAAAHGEANYVTTNALLSIHECQQALGDQPGAAQSIRKALEVAQTNEGQLGDIAKAQARAKDIAGAMATAQRIPARFFRATIDAFLDIALIQLSAGDLPGSIKTIDSLPPVPPTRDYPAEFNSDIHKMYVRLALALADVHAAQEALDLINRNPHYGPLPEDLDLLRRHIAAARTRTGIPATLPAELPAPDPDRKLPPALIEYLTLLTGNGPFNTPPYPDFAATIQAIPPQPSQQNYDALHDAFLKDQALQYQLQHLLEDQFRDEQRKKEPQFPRPGLAIWR
jgi:tetratricopeptide (TPR) repeat protein